MQKIFLTFTAAAERLGRLISSLSCDQQTRCGSQGRFGYKSTKDYALVVLMCVGLVGCISTDGHLWAYRSGDYSKAINPQCVTEGLLSDARVKNLEDTLEQGFYNGVSFPRHVFSYFTQGSENPKRLSVGLVNDKRTSFYHAVTLSSNRVAAEQQQELAEEKKTMAQIEQSVGTACHISHIESVILPNQYL